VHQVQDAISADSARDWKLEDAAAIDRVIAAAGERPAGSGANAAPQVVRLAATPSPDKFRPVILPPELRDLYRYD
jgi:hypothetical protein